MSHHVPSHFRTPGDDTVVCLVWVELHVLPDLLCFTQNVAGGCAPQAAGVPVCRGTV